MAITAELKTRREHQYVVVQIGTWRGSVVLPSVTDDRAILKHKLNNLWESLVRHGAEGARPEFDRAVFAVLPKTKAERLRGRL